MESALAVDQAITAWGTIVSKEEILEAQRNDPFCRKVADGLLRELGSSERSGDALERSKAVDGAVNADQGANGCSKTTGTAVSASNRYLLDADGLLLMYIPTENDDESFKIVVPRSPRKAFISYFHDSCLAGQASGKKTYRKLCHVATWPGMKRDAFRYAQGCHVCQTVKPRGGRLPGFLQPITAQRQWHIAACDIMGPYPRSPRGHQYLLAVTDHFSKWCGDHRVPCPSV